jgi:hypothetical protein
LHTTLRSTLASYFIADLARLPYTHCSLWCAVTSWSQTHLHTFSDGSQTVVTAVRSCSTLFANSSHFCAALH